MFGMNFHQGWLRPEYQSLPEHIKDLRFPSTFIRVSSRGLPNRPTTACLLKITDSKNTQRDDRCFTRANTPKYIYCGCRDPLRVKAMFSIRACPGWSAGLGLGILSCRPRSLPSSCLGSDAKPCVSMRGSANPRRLVPVEPRPLVHSSNLISSPAGGGQRQRGLIWKNIIVYPL